MYCLKELSLFVAVCASCVLPAAPVPVDGGTLIIPKPGGSEKVACSAQNGEIRFPFNPAKPGYAEVALPRPLLLGSFRSARAAAKVRVPAGSLVRSMSLRLIDRNDEVFQYVSKADLSEGGEFEVVWEVKPDEFQLSWGGDANRVFDMPGRVLGFAFDFAGGAPASDLTLLGLDVDVEAPPVLELPGDKAVYPLYRLNRDELFRHRGGSGTITLEENGLLLDGIRNELVLGERRNEIVYLPGRPVSLIFDAEHLGGEITAFAVLRDAKNTQFVSPEARLDRDGSPLVLDLGETLAEAVLPVRMDTLFFRNAASGPGALRLKSASLRTVQPLVEALDFGIVTDTPVRVLRKGNEDALALQFTNRSEKAGDFTVTLAYEHFDGTRFVEEVSASLAPGRTFTVKPRRRPDRLGHWQVTATVREAGSPGQAAEKSRSFALLEPAGPTEGRAPGFLFSICTHTQWWSPGEQEKEVLAAALCGAKVIRDSVEWYTLQPAADRWNFAPMDALVEAYGKVGIELQAMLAFTARWAAPEKLQNAQNWLEWSRCKPDSAAWRNYAATVFARYRDKIRFWEVWNEPDLVGFNRMSLDEYVELQKIAFEEARKVSPELKLLTGGYATLTPHQGLKSPDFQRDNLVKAKGFYDIHAYHEHGSFPAYVRLLDEKFLPMRAGAGITVPWYANETAIHSLGGTEREQAYTLFKKLLFAWSRGAIGYTWYDLRNDGFDPKNAEHNYGMLDNEFYPKPVYSVYNMLAGLFREAQFRRQLEIGNGSWAFEFAVPGGILIPAWNESGATRTLPVTGAADSAFVIDAMGNRSALPVTDGMVLFEFGQAPVTLFLPGATRAEVGQELLAVKADGFAVPGKPFPVRVRLRNPLNSKRTFSLKAESLPEGFTVDRAGKQVSVNARGETEAGFRLTARRGDRPQAGDRRLKLSYALSGTPWKGTVEIPIQVAVPVSAKKGAPDFVLDSRSQVHSLTGADPALLHRAWSGPEDLSGKIRLENRDGAFVLKADVTDDRHIQPCPAEEAWNGDSVQFAFALPGQAGFWEFCLSLSDSGEAVLTVPRAPRGYDSAQAAAAGTVKIVRKGTTTGYEFRIPDRAVGLTPELYRQGFRFNLLINDNDGEGRDGWIQIAPGIGDEKNPGKFPFVIFE